MADQLSPTKAAAALVEYMQASGVVPTEPQRIVADGRICRFHVAGEKHGSRNGWAVLYCDHAGTAGGFGNWKTGLQQTWFPGGEKPSRVTKMRNLRALIAVKKARDAERQALAEAAACRAADLWQKAAPAEAAHPYLVAKQVEPHGIRQSGDRLLIPARDARGQLCTLQFIGPDGGKRFLRDGRIKAAYYGMGGAPHCRLLVAEGFATAASLHEATGDPAAVAFSAGNLKPVALALRSRFPAVEIVVCADNDANTDGNPGIRFAEEAARAVGGRVAIPPVAGDFNDVARREAAE